MGVKHPAHQIAVTDDFAHELYSFPHSFRNVNVMPLTLQRKYIH